MNPYVLRNQKNFQLYNLHIIGMPRNSNVPRMILPLFHSRKDAQSFKRKIIPELGDTLDCDVNYLCESNNITITIKKLKTNKKLDLYTSQSISIDSFSSDDDFLKLNIAYLLINEYHSTWNNVNIDGLFIEPDYENSLEYYDKIIGLYNHIYYNF